MSETRKETLFYDQSTNRFTVAGHQKFREVMERNPYPSAETIQQLSEEAGAPLIRCQNKFIYLRKRSKRPQKPKTARRQATAAPVTSPATPQRSPRNLLLSRFSDALVEALDTEVVSINLDSFFPSKNLMKTTVDRLKTLTNDSGKNGLDLFNWLSCEVDTAGVKKSRGAHHSFSLSGAIGFKSVKCPILNAEKAKLMRELNMKAICLQKHHIVLRRRIGSIPVLGLSATAATVSHLCDTLGCLRPEHLIDESMATNSSRKRCNGLIVGVRGDAITGVTPCYHGVERCAPVVIR